MRHELIRWEDATSYDEWTHRSDLNPAANTIWSCGIYVTETAETVTLALNHDTVFDNFSCIVVIPKGCILERICVGGGPSAVQK